MKIEIKNYSDGYRYFVNEWEYRQKEFDYIFKYLDFEKLYKDSLVHFKDYKLKEWFCKTYTNNINLETIYNESPEGYQYLKENWGNGIFRMLSVYYPDKQELKTIVNKMINVEFGFSRRN